MLANECAAAIVRGQEISVVKREPERCDVIAERVVSTVRNMEVRQITRVRASREHAVGVLFRVEMRTRGRERGLAFADRMNVNGVLPRLQILDCHLDEESAGCLDEVGGARRDRLCDP